MKINWDDFHFTESDMEEIVKLVRVDHKLINLTSLAKTIVKRRLEFGHDVSPSLLKEWTGKDAVRVWDPAGKWSEGDGVIGVTLDKSGKRRESVVGEVVQVGVGTISIRYDGKNQPAKYATASPGSKEAVLWHETVLHEVEEKYASNEINEQVEGVVLKHGGKIVSALLHAIESDGRFVGLAGNWFLKELLPRVPEERVERIYMNLTMKANGEELKKDLEPQGVLEKMAIRSALESEPKKFKNAGTKSQPVWEAFIPSPEEAVFKKYAYDPSTYMILCEPDQKPNKNQLQRLNELGLYAHVVGFAA